MLESKLQTKIIKHLEKEGWFTIKTIKMSKNGMPDIQAFKDGKCMMIEVKAKGKKPRPLQEYRIEEISKYGVHAFWVDDYDVFKKSIHVICS